MKPDEGHNLTEKELAKLERRIASVYGEAAKELQETVDNYFRQFEKRDAEMKELIGTVVNGKEWTERDYKQWRLNQIGRGERFKALQKRVAERYTKANQTAVSYVNDATPGIYSLNRNYAAYTIESVAGDVGFDLWDEQTVKRLIKDDPDLMPYYPAKRALNRGIDLAYGKRQISACVTSSILQGKSIKGMADDLQTRIPTMNRDSAIRTARTAVTNAQNAGRMDSYVATTKIGIDMEREWVSTLDARTRPEHAEADGQVVGVDEPFIVGGEKLMFPGDRSGSGWNIYNCRCTQIAKVKGVDTSDAKRRARDPETGESVLIENMSYAEWAGWKRKQPKKEVETPKITTREQAYKTLTDDIGFGSVSENVSVIDEKLLVENVTQLKKLNDRFWALTADNNGYFTATSEPKAVAYSLGSFRNLNNQSMSLCGNSYGRGYDFLVAKERNFVSTNWSMPCLEENLPIYTVTHEYGHIFENKVINSRVDMDVFEQEYKAKMLEKNGAKKAKDFLKKEETKQAKTIWQEITQIAKEENPDFLVSKNISEYGKTNYFEAFAETFANSQCGSPNELGKAMNIWLERNGY